MDFAKIRPRGGTKAQWEKANPVLAKREIGVQWETTIGVGEVVIKIGDGVTDWINLPEAVKSDITKKIIAALAVVPDDDPDLVDGDSLDTLFGKIAKKFKYLKDNKLDKSARYDGTDSTSTELVPTANALRGVNAKADKNASDITTLNNNLSKFGNLRFLTANTFADAWNKAEAGYTYFIDITSNTDPPTTTANRWFGQMWKNDTGKYGWQVAWSFNGTIYKRERNNSDAWTDWNTYALKSDLDSSKLKSMTFTAMSDEYAQIAIGNPGILICAVSNNYLLARQDNGVCRVIGDIRNNELSFKRNVKVSGIAFYV